MAKASTAKSHLLPIEVEFDPTGAPGVYTTICGIVDMSVNRTASIDTTETPDCADESKPLSIEKSVRNVDVSVSGTGVWAMESSKAMMDWFYSTAPKNVRIRNAKVEADGASGDPYVESGPALLTELTNDKPKGKVVTASIKIDFDGTPAITTKA